MLSLSPIPPKTCKRSPRHHQGLTGSKVPVQDLPVTCREQPTKEAVFQALTKNAFDLLALTDAEGRYLYVSPSFTELLGHQPPDILGTVCFSYMHPEDLPRIRDNNTVLHSQSKKIAVAPYRFRDAAGRWRWIESVVTNQLHHPQINGVVVSARDVTEQVSHAAKLTEMRLLAALQEGEEKERTRIARVLHDKIAGLIAAAKMQFSCLLVQAPQAAPPEGFRQGMDLLEKAAVQVRQTSHNLMPEILLEKGLGGALQRYCQRISSQQVPVDFYELGESRRYATAFELSLYRIAQELVNNILKHAGATAALLQLSHHGNLLTLSAEDNGLGFCPAARREGTGLSSIARRVAAMGGRIEIVTAKGGGTLVHLEFRL